MTRVVPVLIALCCAGCDTTCGEYRVGTDISPDGCGVSEGAFGYTRDTAAVLLIPESGPVTDWLGSWWLTFDSDYLEEGMVLDTTNARASCSRSDVPLGFGYLTSETADFEATLVEDKGLRDDSVLGPTWRWRMTWRIDCGDLDMSATGTDHIDLDAGLTGFFPETFLPPPERP